MSTKSKGLLHKTILVEPVDRPSYQGRDLRKQNTTLKVTKAYKAVDELKFQRDSSGRKFITGLDDFAPINPLKFEGKDGELDIYIFDLMQEYKLSQAWEPKLKKIVLSDKITYQTYYEIIDSVEPDTYTSLINQKHFVNSGFLDPNSAEPTFLQRFSVILYPGVNTFSTSTSRGRLAYHLLQNNNLVAKSKNDINNSIHGYFISFEKEAEIETLSTIDFKNDSIVMLRTLQKDASQQDVIDLATLLYIKPNVPLTTGKNISYSKAVQSIDDFLKSGTTSQNLGNHKQFQEVFELYTKNKMLFDVKVLLERAKNNSVIIVRPGNVVWREMEAYPEVYRFDSIKQLEEFLYKEYDKLDEKEVLEGAINYYDMLTKQVNGKG